MLNVLDGASRPNNLITIITTNHIERLDPALTRCGRINKMMKFGSIIKEQIKLFIDMYEIKLTEQNYKAFEKWCLSNEIVSGTLSAFLFDNREILRIDTKDIIKMIEKFVIDMNLQINNNNNSNLYN